MAILRPAFPGGAKLVTAVVLSLLLGACSSTTFFYNRLDTLIHWAVDDYVDFDRPQARIFERQLDALLDWHRAEELPRYIEFLDRLLRLLDEPLQPADTAAMFAEFEDAADRLQYRAIDMMFVVGESLSAEQRALFVERLQERQQDRRKKLLKRSQDEWQDDLVDNFDDNLSDFMGRLSDRQRQQIRAAVTSFNRLDGEWLDERDRWLAALASVLAEHEVGWQSPVRDILEQRGMGLSEDYQRSLDANLTQSRELLRELINGRTERQDKRLRRALRRYRDDFATLVAQGDSVE